MKTMNTLKNLLATERTHTTCTPEPTYKALRDYLNPYGDSFEKAELELTASVELNLSREQLLELEDPAVLADRQINFYMPESEIDSIMDARTEDEVLAAEFGFDDVEELDRWLGLNETRVEPITTIEDHLMGIRHRMDAILDTLIHSDVIGAPRKELANEFFRLERLEKEVIAKIDDRKIKEDYPKMVEFVSDFQMLDDPDEELPF